MVDRHARAWIPAAHGIFDFILRDPKTMKLLSSMADMDTAAPHAIDRTLSSSALGGGVKSVFCKARTFWQILDKAGVPSIILRMPNNFPPLRVEEPDTFRHGHAGHARRVRYLHLLHG